MGGTFSFFTRVFSLNTKSLSYFRIGIGVILLFDLIRRTLAFDALFLETGIMPYDLLLSHHAESSFRSVYTALKAQRWSILMLVIHWIVVVCYTLGWKTKEMSILVWIFTASMYGRNPMILNGGDTLIRVGLFWAMFLPLGEHYSLDAKIEKKKWEGKEEKTFYNIATIGFIVQLLCVYIFTFLMKTDPVWFGEFTAIYYALSLDAFRTSIGDILYGYPELMKFLTALAYFIEGYGALLLFVPRKQNNWKKACIILFVLFHLGLMSAMHLGPFPIIAMIYWIALRPREGKIAYQPLSTLTQGLLVIALGLVICWNVRTLDFEKHEERFPRTINRAMFTLRLEQSRSMFSPYPFKDDGRYKFTGTDMYGKDRIINQELPGITYDGQGLPDRHYTSEMRHKYYTNMRKRKNSYLRTPFLHYACDLIPDLKRISMDYVREYTTMDYTHRPHETVHLSTLTCR